MAAQHQRGIPVSTLCPKYLHANSTSHTWPFSAIAELIDNAYDPDVGAKQFWIDKTVVHGQECLSFMDNGNGLNHDTMHKMLRYFSRSPAPPVRVLIRFSPPSFGYSDKTVVNGVHPIGIYGNGFKSGSMRIGRDAIVFSKSKEAACVGMLSQSYLEQIQAEQIRVPIISFEQTGSYILRWRAHATGAAHPQSRGPDLPLCVPEEQRASLEDILRYSPFTSEAELLNEINIIGSALREGNTGTRIIIWNLRRTSSSSTEFDFQKDRYDIRIPSDVYEAMNHHPQLQDSLSSHTPRCVFSLRAYCSILYLKPRMQIIIRGQKVKSQLVAKSLALVRKDHYRPAFFSEMSIFKKVPITFGYNTNSKDQYGVMMYHKNRLIKAYERVGCQIKANNKGVGVIGVIECNFLEPTHNKQSFMENDKYRKTMNSLAVKLEEYWNEIRYRKHKENPGNTTPVEDTTKRPDQNWVQCDDCSKWRKLPDGIDISKLPSRWSCHQNPDPQYRSCQAEEELEDSDDEQLSYTKTYKKQEREEKKMQEKLRVEAQRREELPQAEPNRRLVSQPLTPPTTPRSRVSSDVRRGGAARAEDSPQSSPAACSPSSSSLPVIAEVYSLSDTLSLKRKRKPGEEPKTKRPKENGLPSSAVTPPSVSNDGDDDILIMEEASTPIPKKSAGLELKKVKTERDSSPGHVVLQLECSDDAAVDVGSHAAAREGSGAEAGGSSPAAASAPVPQVSSSTTQTEVPVVKEESPPVPGGADVGPECSGGRAVQDGRPENQPSTSLQNGGADARTESGPSCPSQLDLARMDELQSQQDQLLDIMTATAKERDQYREEVHRLTCQLQELQASVQVKTEPPEEQMDYRGLFEKANQKVDELIREKQTSTELLDQRTRERVDLQAQVDQLEEEKAGLLLQCEELRETLQQRGASPEPRRSSGGSEAAQSLQHDSFQSLVELRHNIGRLLVKHVPDLDLDLDQVNYECNVIDEILEQYLSQARLWD
ncbi:LOW QUALITY PROTEIN: MORC family CW-type zinc finger protein 3a [Neosynchiropus ocellatus]